ncbi:MAG: GIY-YIG nuclease family protein [Candidatus Dependentiae bacterium]|nr:GIY-YIG nuclease family protein [Candidatus Dependentiae bacterium]
MDFFYVYILQCNDRSYYIGSTDDIHRRLDEHIQPVKKESNAFSYVAERLPFKLVFVEEFERREDAQEAERRLKGWPRKKKEALINSGWEAVPGVTKKGAFTQF